MKNKRIVLLTWKTRSIKLLFIALLGMYTFVSCSDKETPPDDPEIVPEEYLYRSYKVLEFKEIHNEKQVEKDTGKALNDYFESRIQLDLPSKLEFKDDSVSIIKANGVAEQYRIEWRGNELYIYNPHSEEWEYCGEKADKDKFHLHVGFYVRKNINIQRSLTVMGQEYGLMSYAEMAGAEAEYWVAWQNIQYVFEQKK